MRRWMVLTALVSAPALAKPWHGIEPGVSRLEMVIEKFGAPTRRVPTGAKEILAYIGAQAIRGTKQAQFRVDSRTGTVERIDVFPAPVIDLSGIEESYGPVCRKGGEVPCYVKKVTKDQRVYLDYVSLGLAIFLNADGKTVHSFVFQLASA